MDEQRARPHPSEYGLRLAEGYEWVERLDTPWRLGVAGTSLPGKPIWMMNADGTNRVQMLDGHFPKDKGIVFSRFSSNGSRLYCIGVESFYVDVVTGSHVRLPTLDLQTPYDDIRELHCSPDGATLLLLLTKASESEFGLGSPEPVQVRMCNTDGSNLRTVYADAGEFHTLGMQPCWHLDFVILEQWHATTADNRFMSVELTSGRQTVQEMDDSWATRYWRLSLDGAHLALVDSWRRDIRLQSISPGSEAAITLSGSAVAWHPNSQQVAYLPAQHTLSTYDLTTSTTRNLIWFDQAYLDKRIKSQFCWTAPEWSADGSLLWFQLGNTTRQPRPRNFREMVNLCSKYLHPVLQNMKRNNKVHHCGYRHEITLFVCGVIDMANKRAIMLRGNLQSIQWINPSSNSS